MATLRCYYCKKLDIEHNRDGKSKIMCVDCDKKKGLNVNKETLKLAFKNGADIAFRQHGENEWIYTNDPLWKFDTCDYKIIDLQKDDYYY